MDVGEDFRHGLPLIDAKDLVVPLEQLRRQHDTIKLCSMRKQIYPGLLNVGQLTESSVYPLLSRKGGKECGCDCVDIEKDATTARTHGSEESCFSIIHSDRIYQVFTCLVSLPPTDTALHLGVVAPSG